MSMLKDWIFGLLGKETSRERMEIGRGADGEMSAEALRLWIRWSVMALGICLAAVSVMASVSAVRNRREAAILEVDSGEVLEFYLNRKGTVLKTKADAAEVLEDHSLEEGIEKILQGFLDHGYLEADGAVIFTLRPSEAGIQADLERFAEEIHVYAEEFLRKKHSDGVVYVHVLDESAAVEELAGAYGVSRGKAALVQDLVDENLSLRKTDIERLLGMSVVEISEEMNERNYKTSFIEVVAKLVYAQMLEIEKETEVSEKETETVKETEKAPTVASTAAMETEAPENGEASVEVTEESVEGEGSDASETEESSAQESDESETEEHLDISETEQETDHTDPVAAETEPETTAAAETAPETSAETQPETTATEPAVQPESGGSGQVTPETAAPVETAQPQPETAVPETSTAAQPETTAPEQTQPAGSIIEQVIPLTPAG